MSKSGILLALVLFSSPLHASAFGRAPAQPAPAPQPTPPSVTQPADPSEVVRALWEPSQRDGVLWSKHVYERLPVLAPSLLSSNLADTREFCANYGRLPIADKKNFWVYLISAMAQFESNFNPATSYTEAFIDAKGNRVVSRGLLQISIESGNAYGCGFKSESELHDPYKNLDCGLRILERWIRQDGRIAGRVGTIWQGGARYWSVLRYVNAPLAKIQSYTQGLRMCME